MHFKQQVVTDIAMIGVWDIGVEHDHVSRLGHKEFESAIIERARAGEIFYMNTNGDGCYDVSLYVQESLPDQIQDYKLIDKNIYLRCESGQLIIAGVEYFGDPDIGVSERRSMRIDPAFGEICDISPGSYRIHVYQYNFIDDEERA